MAGLFLIAALHLGCGRRLMWAGTMLLVFHLCKVRGIFTLRARYLVVAIPLVLLVSLWMEATKNIGWYSAADASPRLPTATKSSTWWTTPSAGSIPRRR
jgi:hypothetical protein